MTECSKLLSGIGNLYAAFSVHQKRESYTVKTLPEAIGLVGGCHQLLAQNEFLLRAQEEVNVNALNGPQGNVSAKTVKSVEMLEWGLQKLHETLSVHGYDHCKK